MENDNSARGSILGFVDEHTKGYSDSSVLTPSLWYLMQTTADPPFESIWVYSALTFQSKKSTKDDIFKQILAVHELFQLISACSANYNCLKSVSLLAPVVYEMHKLILEELLEKKELNLNLKREKKVIREIVSLVDAILGYISLCFCSNEEGNLVGLTEEFKDLVKVWMKGNGGEKEGLELFLPLVSEGICKELSEESCVVRCLAGVVVAEAFLLKLSLKFWGGVPRSELEKELKNCAVGSITRLQNYHFFETLLKMLLEPTLPVTSLLKSDDEALLRKILNDAVILVDYSFLNPERVNQQPAELMKSLALTRLIVTYEAIEFSRRNGDQKRAISYTNAFSVSRLPSQLINWVTNQNFTVGKDSRPSGSSPKALLKWLLSFENKGIRIFNDSISKHHSRLILDFSKKGNEPPEFEAESKHSQGDPPFYIDNKGMKNDGDGEHRETAESKFVVAARTMKTADNDERKKRKEIISEKMNRTKFLKSDAVDKSDTSEDSLTTADDSSSESEVESPQSSDDDIN